MSVSRPLYITLLLLALNDTMLAQLPAAGKETASISRQLILPAGKTRLDTLAAMVARQTGHIFSFNAQRIDPALYIAIPRNKITLAGLLQHLSDHHQLRYRLAGHYIIIQQIYKAKKFSSKKPGVSAPAPGKGNRLPTASQAYRSAHGTLPGLVNTPQSPLKYTLRTGNTLAIRTTPGKRSAALRTVSPTIVRASIGHTPAAVAAPSPKPITASSIRRMLAKKSTAPAHNQAMQQGRGNNNSKSLPFFIAAGLAVDDVFYLAPTIQAGLPWLYLAAKWNTNFDVQGLSYGLGSSITLSEDWQACIEASVGKLSKDFITPDTFRIPIQVKGRLLRVAFLAQKQVGEHWLLRFGPILNHLHTEYYSNEKPTLPGSRSGTGMDIDRTYYTVKPLYTLHNSFERNTASNNKLWVGLQISLLYRIPSFNKER